MAYFDRSTVKHCKGPLTPSKMNSGEKCQVCRSGKCLCEEPSPLAGFSCAQWLGRELLFTLLTGVSMHSSWTEQWHSCSHNGNSEPHQRTSKCKAMTVQGLSIHTLYTGIQSLSSPSSTPLLASSETSLCLYRKQNWSHTIGIPSSSKVLPCK